MHRDFPDVPCPSTFADWIEALAAEGITGGCGGGNYCPTIPVRRDQMAVFLLKAEHGSAYVPPPCTGVFPDVPCPSTFADWIEQLAAENITGGCGGGNYCPSNNTAGSDGGVPRENVRSSNSGKGPESAVALRRSSGRRGQLRARLPSLGIRIAVMLLQTLGRRAQVLAAPGRVTLGAGHLSARQQHLVQARVLRVDLALEGHRLVDLDPSLGQVPGRGLREQVERELEPGARR